MQFDHVALATDDVTPVLKTLVSELGGTIVSGGSPGPFRALQLRLGSAADGMTIELLEPWDVSQGDFLRRFLDDRGEGPHHLTFKTDDILGELARVRDLGYEPVGVQVESAFWREFFLHPVDGHGTVIQVAQLMVDEPAMAERMETLSPWSSQWWPDVPTAEKRTILDRVVLGSPEPEQTCRFLVDVLGGTRQEGALVAWGRDRVAVEPADAAGLVRLDVRELAETRRVSGVDLVPF